MELENIRKTIHQKIQNLTGEAFPLENDFDEQILEIREHYLAALDSQFHPKDVKSLRKYLNERSNFGIESEKLRESVRNKFNQTFIRTDSWVHKNIDDNWTSEYYYLVSPDWKKEITDGYPFYPLNDQWAIIEKTIKYLKSEELNKVRKCFVNIVDRNYYPVPEKAMGFYSDYILLIYLITSERIITTYINKEKVILSTEHIIKKDLKKVEIADETKVQFHYHGLHQPDVLLLDSYELAIEVRKEITELRENKFNIPYTKH